MDRRELPLGPAALTAVLLLGAACGSGRSCPEPTPAAARCADLLFRGHTYDERRTVDVSGTILQELGDASYPACNAAGDCGGDDLAGFGATDVWLLDGVEPTRAVIGLREGTETYVVFVRVGVDPATVPGR